MGIIKAQSFDEPSVLKQMPSAEDPKVNAKVVDFGTCQCMKIEVTKGVDWKSCMGILPGAPATCQTRHVGICVKGELNVVMDDGTKFDIKEGDSYLIEPGHIFTETKSDVEAFEIVSKVEGAASAGGASTYMIGDTSEEAKENNASFDVKRFDDPNVTTKEMKNGKACVCFLGNKQAKGMVCYLQPGWTWATGAKALLPEDKQHLTACPARHVGFIKSGTFGMTDVETGTETVAKAGMCYLCEPGHEARVIGDEPVEFIEFESVGPF